MQRTRCLSQRRVGVAQRHEFDARGIVDAAEQRCERGFAAVRTELAAYQAESRSLSEKLQNSELSVQSFKIAIQNAIDQMVASSDARERELMEYKKSSESISETATNSTKY